MANPVVTAQAGENFDLNELSGTTGLAFFGAAGFGASIRVGEWGETTYISDATGSTEGARCDCPIPTGTGTASIGGVSYTLQSIPNYLATFRITLTAESPVNTQNAVLHVYDGVTLGTAPTGVTIKAAEIIHPGTTADATGTGDASWITLNGTTTPLTLVDNPGNNSSKVGTSTQDTVHQWFAAFNLSPDSIGNHSGKVHFECEYL